MQTIINELRELNLYVMANKFEELQHTALNHNLSVIEQMQLIVHAELTAKRNRKIKRLLHGSGLRTNVRMEDVSCDAKRGLKREQFLSLMRLDFMNQHQNIIITGATGCGKTHLACAIGNKACIEGYKVKFVKLPVFLEELHLSHINGGFMKLIQQLMQYDLLILDDFGITPINESQRHDLLTIIDERYKLKPIIITSQLTVKSWHTYLGEPTVADAILDRVLSQSARIELAGKSLRWNENSAEINLQHSGEEFIERANQNTTKPSPGEVSNAQIALV